MVLTLLGGAAAQELPAPAPGPSAVEVAHPDRLVAHVAISFGMAMMPMAMDTVGFAAYPTRFELGAGRGRLRVSAALETETLDVTPWWDTDAFETGGLLGDSRAWQAGPSVRYVVSPGRVWLGARAEGGLAVLVTPLPPEIYADEFGADAERPGPDLLEPWAAVGFDVSYPLYDGALLLEGAADVAYVSAVGLQVQHRVGATARF